MNRVTAKIWGRVQGVSFRYYTQLEAKRLNLVGWVRNEPDGSVTVVAEGSKEYLIELLHFLDHGPRGARVDRIVSNWSPASQEFTNFEIRWL